MRDRNLLLNKFEKNIKEAKSNTVIDYLSECQALFDIDDTDNTACSKICDLIVKEYQTEWADIFEDIINQYSDKPLLLKALESTLIRTLDDNPQLEKSGQLK